MSSFELPKQLVEDIAEIKRTKPRPQIVNNSRYYSHLGTQYSNFFESVVRPAISYGSGVIDGANGNPLTAGIGRAVVNRASNIIIGDKLFWESKNERTTAFFSEVFSQNVKFREFLNSAVKNTLLAGTSILKLSRDKKGAIRPLSYRLDRTLFSCNEYGDITECLFFITQFTSLQQDKHSYWLTEKRYYNDNFEPCYVFQVFSKETDGDLPSPYQKGIAFRNLPPSIQRELVKSGVQKLNEEIVLPFVDGLGCWLMKATADNSISPDLPFGDPLLYGSFDLLWETDIVMSGITLDLFNGQGKVVAQASFLSEMTKNVKTPKSQTNYRQNLAYQYHQQYANDDTYLFTPPAFTDKESYTPFAVQFDIRADQYSSTLDMFLKLLSSSTGLAPTSLFAWLDDNSNKTATEVTKEENMTRATVSAIHELILEPINAMLREVVRQENKVMSEEDKERYGEFCEDIRLRLNDYVGNKLLQDENVRANYTAGVISRETAIKTINNFTTAELEQEIAKIDEDEKRKNALMGQDFNDSDYFGDLNGGSERVDNNNKSGDLDTTENT